MRRLYENKLQVVEHAKAKQWLSVAAIVEDLNDGDRSDPDLNEELGLALLYVVKECEFVPSDRAELVQKLFEKGALDCGMEPRTRNTSKHIAILRDDLPTLKVLLEHNEITCPNADGETPIVMAAKQGKWEAVKVCYECLSIGSRTQQAELEDALVIIRPLAEAAGRQHIVNLISEPKIEELSSQSEISAGLLVQFLSSPLIQGAGLILLVVGMMILFTGVGGVIAGVEIIGGSSVSTLLIGGAAETTIGAVLKFGSRLFQPPLPPTEPETIEQGPITLQF